MKLYGGIETGGTKCVCMIAGGPDEVIAESRFSTTTPEETLLKAITFFREQKKIHNLSGLGIGTFGPVDLDPDSATFGYITTTPKPGWANVNLAKRIENELQMPTVIDTDVNAAAMGEYLWGNAGGISPFVYFTIGTGIGMGGLFNGSLMHGLIHPEAGHMILKRDPITDPYAGFCAYHGDCFEGLASGPAIRARWGQSSHTMPDQHPAWKLEANYIAQAMVNTIVLLSPRKIILGGGVMQREHLFPMIQREVVSMLNGYVKSPQILNQIEDFIVPAKLGGRAGVLGSIALAVQAFN
ncbi:MAG: ROK family protein [Anaerolineae bacterium]|nr:ROK family protein [Anaerolineae bacterium]